MTRPRDRYKPKVFAFSYKAGQTVDIAGIGCVTFLEDTRVRWSIPDAARVTTLDPDDVPAAAALGIAEAA